MKTLAHEGDKAEILRRLKALRPDSPRRWGRMSPHQMVCHLADSFRVALGQMAVSTDTSLLNRTIVKWVALYSTLPWPPGFRTRPEIDQVRGCGSRPGNFAADVAALEVLVGEVTAPEARLDPRGHPIFGEMSHADWLRWGYLHIDHHIRQFGA